MSRRRSPRVVLGLQGIQLMGSHEYGVGGWARGYIAALMANQPQLVAAVAIDAALPIPEWTAGLPNDLPLVDGDGGATDANAFHLLAPLADLPTRRLWPAWATDPSIALIASVHDSLSPLSQPRSRYPRDQLLVTRHHMLEQCDALLATSFTMANELVGSLSVDHRRVYVCPETTSLPTVQRRQRRADGSFLEGFGIKDPFLLCIASPERLAVTRVVISAFEHLPESIRTHHQLVIASPRRSGDELASIHGIADRTAAGTGVMVKANVGDAAVIHLMQSCRLLVVPDLYGGSIAPALDGIASGVRTVVGDVGPLRELVPRNSRRFDPGNADSIRDTLLRAISEDSLEVAGASPPGRYGPDQVARSAAGAYSFAVNRRP